LVSLKNLTDPIRRDDSPADEARSTAKEARHKIESLFGDAKKGARRSYIRGRVAAARATAPRKTRTSAKSVAAAGTAGAAGAYFFDPIAGKRRREQVRERATTLFKRRNGHSGATETSPQPTDASPQETP
jgi:hypothetical protein